MCPKTKHRKQLKIECKKYTNKTSRCGPTGRARNKNKKIFNFCSWYKTNNKIDISILPFCVNVSVALVELKTQLLSSSIFLAFFHSS